MKKIALITISLTAVAVPLLAWAVNFQQGETYAADQVFEENVYIAAEKPVIESSFKGDLTVFGGDVRVLGPVEGDLTVAGGTVWVGGPVSGDIRIAGGEVTINNTVGGEVVVAAGKLDLGSKTRIAKDLTAGVGEIKKDDQVVISGKQQVWDEKAAEKERQKQPKVVAENFNATDFVFGLLFSLTALLLSGLAYFGLFAKSHQVLEDNLIIKKQAASAMGIGLLAIFTAPLAALFILFSGVGYQITLILILAYFFILMLASIIAGPVVGSWIRVVFFKNIEKTTALHITLGIIALHLVSIIPFIGWLVALLITSAVTGEIIRSTWKGSR
jgi:cytoskeletal protein CcmA (bactofilin family)